RFHVVTTRGGAEALRRDGWEQFACVEALSADPDQRVRRVLAEQALLPAAGRRGRWDVLHNVASTAPRWSPAPDVLTLHDVTFFHVETFSRLTTFAMRTIVSRAARHADVLLAVSRAARDDICKTLH